MRFKIKNSPFASKEFESIWLKHFSNSVPAIAGKKIAGTKFIKHSKLPLYFNLGKSHTNGIFYKTSFTKNDNSGKTFFIQDIPGYFEISNKNIGRHTVKRTSQYKGYLADFSNIDSFETYLNKNFNSKNRWQIKKSIKKINTCFQIRYETLYGNQIDPNHFEFIFKKFKELLEKRFSEKKIELHWLQKKAWAYLKELFLEMIRAKKAVIFVLYANDKPVAINANFVSEKVVFSFLPAFDTDFAKFNLGASLISKTFEWCLSNHIKVYDFSKGDYEYKRRWSNYVYNFEHHILYDNKSYKSRFIALLLSSYYNLKQHLRDKKFDSIFHKVVFYLKYLKLKKKMKPVYKIDEIKNLDNYIGAKAIDITEEKYMYLKKPVYNFLYTHSLQLDNISVHASIHHQNKFLIKNDTSSREITFARNFLRF
ncbi:GNAT family N-acetyltransferase [Flagellimonas sp. 2504JD1-5]